MWPPIRLISPILTLVTLPRAYSQATGPVVDLGYARTNTFWALPYAQPPTGDNRFRAPRPLSSYPQSYGSGEIVDATTPGNQCVQGLPAWGLILANLTSLYPISSAQVPTSEDCLILDVIVPQQPRSESLPVIVQIHGGGYTLGNSQAADGHIFVQHSQGSVIYVQIQYRLGAYGFLGGSSVSSDVDANVGLLDQRLALEWVQTNIEAFGGDPSQVTIWGGSAGGGSVTSQLILYGGESETPFRAAVPEYPFWQPYHDTPILEAQYQILLDASGCQDLACVRSLSYEALANASAATYTIGYEQGLYGYGDFYYGPYIDGNVLQDFPSREFQQGRWSRVPILVNHDAFEGVAFANFSITTEAEATEEIRTLFQTDSEEFLTGLDQVYPLSDFTGSYFDNPFFSSAAYEELASVVDVSQSNAVYWKLQAQFGDSIMNCPTYFVSSAAADAGVPVWKLIFQTGTYLHGATNYVLFQDSDRTGLGAGNATLANIMKDYYLAFVTDLDPNAPVESAGNVERPNWSGYGADLDILQVDDMAIGMRGDPDANERCEFFRGQSDIIRI